MDGFFEKYGRMIIVAVAICFVLLYLTPMRNVVGSSINGFAGNFANKVGESLGTVKMPDGSDNIKREPSSMLMKAGSYYPYYNNSQYPSYFNESVPESATKILFTDEKAPNGVKTVDLTAAGDGDVVGWLDGTTWKVSTQDSKKSITFNADSSYMFDCIPNIKEIQFNNINTSQVKNMSGMFEHSSVTCLELLNFDTSNVTNMRSMFQAMRGDVEMLDLSSFNTSKVTDMSQMFAWSENLQSLNVSNLDTSKVTNMKSMFLCCDSLKEVKVRSQTDIDNFKTKNTYIGNNVKFEIK